MKMLLPLYNYISKVHPHDLNKQHNIFYHRKDNNFDRRHIQYGNNYLND